MFQVFALNEQPVKLLQKVTNLYEMRPIFFSGGGAPERVWRALADLVHHKMKQTHHTMEKSSCVRARPMSRTAKAFA